MENDIQTNPMSIPIQKDSNDCIFCLEKINNDTIINYENDDKYTLKCNCRPFIHNSCMEDWIKKNRNCPICLLKISETGEVIRQNNTCPNLAEIKGILRSFCKIIKILFAIIILIGFLVFIMFI